MDCERATQSSWAVKRICGEIKNNLCGLLPTCSLYTNRAAEAVCAARLLFKHRVLFQLLKLLFNLLRVSCVCICIASSALATVMVNRCPNLQLVEYCGCGAAAARSTKTSPKRSWKGREHGLLCSVRCVTGGRGTDSMDCGIILLKIGTTRNLKIY